MIQSLSSSTLLCASAAFTVLYVLIGYWKKSTRLAHLPTAPGEVKNNDYTQVLMNGLEKYPGEAFILPVSPPIVILPNSAVDDVKNRPNPEISFMKEIDLKMHGKYTGLGKDSVESIGAVRNELTRGIQRTLADLQDEVNYAFDTELGPCEDWTETNIYQKLLRIVSIISGRVFVGLPLCRNEQWIQATINFTVDVMDGIRTLNEYPGYLRPLVAPFNKKMQKLDEYKRWAAVMLEPQVKAALAERQQNGNLQKSSTADDDLEKGQIHMIHWMLNHYKDIKTATAKNLGIDQLIMSFAAIHTTSLTATNALLDLAERPEYISELRREIAEVITEEGYADGQLRKTSMPKLKKLDSFIRESQRCNPLGMVTMTRLVTSPGGYTIPGTSQKIPQGSSIAFAHPYQTERSAKTMHSSILTSPNEPPLSEFHPFRFCNIRQLPDQELKHQFVTTGPENLSFGHGHHACPGRFFASNEIKIILVEMIKRFDVALGDGGKGLADGCKRPETLCNNTSYYPDPASKIYLRRNDGLEKA